MKGCVEMFIFIPGDELKKLGYCNKICNKDYRDTIDSEIKKHVEKLFQDLNKQYNSDMNILNNILPKYGEVALKFTYIGQEEITSRMYYKVYDIYTRWGIGEIVNTTASLKCDKHWRRLMKHKFNVKREDIHSLIFDYKIHYIED